ncbi:MAG: nucleotidyltransferase domain-containing protein [Euryarchaeota archaeon]|nr:nucleotidyltransferase domain-containing protein [Euryarchaeota archaeon]MBU4076620.1 nucleotidyltransferase domain-containing protein [Euryarchaeota archaeon]
MISENDKNVILTYAKKYKLEKVILFGSSKERTDARDIDIGVRGIAPALFFDFCWELYRDLSKPVDVIDLSKDCLFNKLIEKDGLVLYG